MLKHVVTQVMGLSRGSSATFHLGERERPGTSVAPPGRAGDSRMVSVSAQQRLLSHRQMVPENT